MPHYSSTDLPYAVIAEGQVWVQSRNGFARDSLGKDTDPSSERQLHFTEQLRRFSDHLGTATIPVFVNWPNVGRRRMDKGCIGHALASGFIEELIVDEAGHVSHVRIRS